MPDGGEPLVLSLADLGLLALPDRPAPIGQGQALRLPGGVTGVPSHTFTVRSSLAEAMRWPSGLNATLLTSPVCPLRVRTSWPVAASHTFTVLSWLAEARRLPSGLNATLLTVAGVPLEGEEFLAGRRVPHLHRLVVDCAEAMRLPSGLNATLVTSAGVSLEGEDLLAGRRVPHLHRLVRARRRRGVCRRG